MTIDQMESKVKELICEVYKMRYMSTLTIETIKHKDEVIGYKLRLNLANQDKPLFVAIEGSQNDFFKLLEVDLRERSLDLTEYQKAKFRIKYNE